MSCLNETALSNIVPIVVTFATFHPPMSWSKALALRNMVAIRGKSSTAPCTIHRMAPDGSIAEFWPDTTAKDTAKSQNPIITSPADNAVFRIVPGIPDQAVTARAGKVASTETLWWFLNAKPVGTTRGDGMLILSPPPKGLHRLTCSTADGRSASISFTVK